ncbi:hypothetical protein [Paenibacillus physcomitrellae]|uniref:Uncharacterized protein n=1 Tax=Paenibacillus physcomitrellae TaxID=1619311 RepID=A0ABQ1G4D7_9BACL|nr:hypothetical protein [Paenibacillus physcomitrellae]GGA36360.1 hypothetical protein GCM10010917_21960 [Paenibacillus physcomitrellae]
MLETERYAEAADLLRFLLQCQVQDDRHYEEWEALLKWLQEAFPAAAAGTGQGVPVMDVTEDAEESDFARKHAEMKFAEDRGYALKLLQTVTEKPLSEHTFLALEQLSFIQSPEIDEALVKWLEREERHPMLQFRVLQTLRRRETGGVVRIWRGGELSTIEIDAVPLTPEDFPPAVQDVLDRVGREAQVHDPAMFYFAQEFWYQFIMGVYGTADYASVVREEEASLDIWAAALHQTVTESLQGGDGKAVEELRAAYGITDSMRLRFEQAHRAMKQFASTGAIF